MKANELRRAFTEYFVERDHLEIPSASLIPHDDSLLFVNSGMVPFKPFFIGEEKPPHQRAVTVQKCVRAGGKHNDLDEVGRTTRHFTFFEMMGNFSFGDYFKERAIPMAWEFVTEVLRLDPERLWVTVHLSDDEAAAIWRDEIGIPAERIQRLDEDNWWRMADTGPNGPCSEIFWDKGSAYGADGGPAHGGEERFVEIWNLVFMQFETDEAGDSRPLPKPSIDTGAGLERVLAVLQGKDSIFEIDEMARLIEVAEQVTGYQLGHDDNSDLALRVLAEHARTMTFLISDGVFPSNEDRGYVLRRIMRRAVRFAYLLGVEDLVTPRLVDSVIEIMADDYPELRASHELILSVVEREEAQFRRTLVTGSNILDDQLAKLEPGGELAGSVAFLLHDTYGFPVEVTAEVVVERGFTVDQAGFDTEMEAQRTRAKQARKGSAQDADFEQVQAMVEGSGQTDFVGRTELTDIEAMVLLVTDNLDGTRSVFLDRSPFYAESGGQIGDTGTITTKTGTAQVIETVYAVPGVNRHVVEVAEGVIEAGQFATASIDTERRDAIRRNHTGTHLLHWALRQVLGDHVKQQGSMVGPDRLRFDFSHFDPLTADEIATIEDLVNAEVIGNAKAEHPEVTKAEAEEMGAVAFFGDKYGDLVRVLRAGPSLEFCGGTHVSALGDIGLVKVVSEGSIGANLRRVEAVTGMSAVALLREEQAVVDAVAELLNVPRGDVVDGVTKRVSEIKSLRDEIKGLQANLAVGQASTLAGEAVDGVVVARVDGLSRDQMKDLAVAVRDQNGIRAVVLGGAPDGGGAALVSAVSADSDLKAGALIADGAKAIKGGGGKGDDMAMAGGKDPAGLDDALALASTAAGISS
ncbi:MAG: alanine--tRNA ligase [Actinomycetia bacterium]|nr:alanine--tRNA ligase [Actinomycetes bacterium]